MVASLTGYTYQPLLHILGFGNLNLSLVYSNIICNPNSLGRTELKTIVLPMLFFVAWSSRNYNPPTSLLSLPHSDRYALQPSPGQITTWGLISTQGLNLLILSHQLQYHPAPTEPGRERWRGKREAERANERRAHLLHPLNPEDYSTNITGWRGQ